MANQEAAPVVAVVVYKRNPLVTLGRAQKYRWRAVNWNNRKTLAVSSEAYTNYADALSAAVELFADSTVDAQLLEAAGHNVVVSRAGSLVSGWVPSNVYLIRDGVSGMQPLRLWAAA